MANKKITQLDTVDSAIGIGSESMFPVASGSPTDTYLTSKVSSVDVAKYVLNPMPVGGSTDLSSIGFTGSSEIKFDKNNWVNASTNVEVNPYLQVRLSDGQLITGSGVAVPAALGDNMGDCVATTHIDMQGNDISGLDDIAFKDDGSHPASFISNVFTAGKLKVQAGQDLVLSGNGYVGISGQALDLASTPISGNVTITGGDLEIDPENKLTTNRIIVSGVEFPYPVADDYGSLEMSKAAIIGYTDSNPENVWQGNIYWNKGNLRHTSALSNTTITSFRFYNVKDGQTYTMYVRNDEPGGYTEQDITFKYSMHNVDATTGVFWGAEFEGTQPTLVANKTNIYTFVCIGTGVFASAVTGYDY